MKTEDGILVLESLDRVSHFFEDCADRSKGAPVEVWGPFAREAGFFGYLVPPGAHGSERGGRILATEQSNKCVRLRFELGDFPDYDLFWREVSSLVEEMNKRGFRVSESTASAGDEAGDEETALPKWLPKGKRRETWKEAYYKAILPLRQEYREEYRLGYIDSPKPSTADFRDRIADVTCLTYSESTIQRIQRAGYNGWLK